MCSSFRNGPPARRCSFSSTCATCRKRTLGAKKLIRFCIKRKRISGISRLSFYRVFSSRLSFYLLYFQIIEYQRVKFEIPRNFHQNRRKKTLILSKSSEQLRKNQQILQKFERCLKRILQIEAVQKCENLVDLEKC